MELVHKEVTEKILGASFDVHNQVGYGHREVVYQRALALAMKTKGLDIQEQYRVSVLFNGKNVGMSIVDYCVSGCVLVEIKCNDHFRSADFRQLHGYLQSTGMEVGLLIAFGHQAVKFKRIVNLKDFCPVSNP